MTREEIEKLYIDNKDTAKAFALAMCQNQDDADDILSEVFLEILENAGNIDQKGAKQYLYRSVHNRTINHYKRQAQRSEAYSESLPDQDDCQADFPQLHNAIKDLPDRQAVAIYLHYWKQMDYDAIAQEMQCPINTVNTLLYRAKNKLRELMTNG